MTTPNSNYHTSSNAAAISKGRDSTEWTPLRLDTMGNSDPENGQTVTEEQKKGGEEEKEEEEKEPFCTKERIIKAFVLLGISIVNKLVAVNMIKIGVRNKDKCPAEDAIPKFMLGELLHLNRAMTRYVCEHWTVPVVYLFTPVMYWMRTAVFALWEVASGVRNIS